VVAVAVAQSPFRREKKRDTVRWAFYLVASCWGLPSVADGALVPLPIGKSGLSRAWGVAYLDHVHHPQTLKALIRLCSDRLPEMLTV
jgi:hypothetical protein